MFRGPFASGLYRQRTLAAKWEDGPPQLKGGNQWSETCFPSLGDRYSLYK